MHSFSVVVLLSAVRSIAAVPYNYSPVSDAATSSSGVAYDYGSVPELAATTSPVDYNYEPVTESASASTTSALPYAYVPITNTTSTISISEQTKTAQATATPIYNLNNSTSYPQVDNTTAISWLNDATAFLNPDLTIEDCAFNSTTGIHAECWEILNMTEHLNTWWSENGAQCGDSGFAECYLNVAGFITWDCDIISLSTCIPPPSGDNAGYQSYQEFYTIWNIYAINQFFSTYHQAIINGQAEAIGAVSEIIRVVAPPVTTNVETPTVGIVFAVSIGILAGLSAFVPSGIPAFVFGSVFGALGGATGLGDLLFPSEEVEIIPWSGVAARMSQQVDDYQVGVGNVLTAVMNNFDAFSDMTSGGGFSQKVATPLPEQTSFMYHDLLKWTFTQAIQAREWFVVKNTGVDPQKIDSKDFKCESYDEHNVCGLIWYDGQDSYGLAQANDLTADAFPDILKVAFDNNWITPQELYVDSQACRTRNSQQGFKPDDLILSCASNTPVCEVNDGFDAKDYVSQRNSGPEFKNCPDQRGWGLAPHGSAHLHKEKARVPMSYLGPFISTGVEYKPL